MVKNRRILGRTLVCFMIIITAQMSGINTLLFYAAVIFNNGASGELSGSQLTLVVGAVQIVSSFLCIILIDLLGRRVLLALSGALTGTFMILQGWYSHVRDFDPQYYDEVYGWMPPTWIALFFVAFNLGLGPISWSILGDSFPYEIKTYYASSVALLSWVISLLATFAFGYLAETLGASFAMWIFGGLCCVGGVLCGFTVSETNGKSLADIQDSFGIEPTQ